MDLQPLLVIKAQLSQAYLIQPIVLNLNSVFKFELEAKEAVDDLHQIHLKANLIAKPTVIVLYSLHEDDQDQLLECLHLNQNDDDAASQIHPKDYQLDSH